MEEASSLLVSGVTIPVGAVSEEEEELSEEEAFLEETSAVPIGWPSKNTDG